MPGKEANGVANCSLYQENIKLVTMCLSLARKLISEFLEEGGDDSLLQCLQPPNSEGRADKFKYSQSGHQTQNMEGGNKGKYIGPQLSVSFHSGQLIQYYNFHLL